MNQDISDDDITYLTYWQARQAMIKALQDEDDLMVAKLSHYYPELFRNMVNQAKKSKRDKEEG